MKLASKILAVATFAVLVACGENDARNIQTEAEETGDALQAEANEILAEAENGVDAAVNALENEASALTDGADGNEASETRNSQ